MWQPNGLILHMFAFRRLHLLSHVAIDVLLRSHGQRVIVAVDDIKE